MAITDPQRCKHGVFNCLECFKVDYFIIESSNDKPIFTITTITAGNIELHTANGIRTVGYYYSLEEAESAVLENRYDINESGHYPYVVIEEIGPGIYQHPKETWYKWEGKIDGKYKKIENSPKDNFCNWSMG